MTAATFLSHIDWSQPWLLPFRDTAAPIVLSSDWRSALNAAATNQCLRNHRSLPIRFVPQSDLPAGVAYESFISETGCIPTRDNLHDFFNALVWLTYPLTKARLNELQAAAIAQAGVMSARGRLRDAITVFDENAALFITQDKTLVEALRKHDWTQLFLERRAEFQHTYHVALFGHALMEKLESPYKAITAHGWPLVAADLTENPYPIRPRTIDELLVCSLSEAEALDTRAFLPLPVLGLPGWQDGQDEAYYQDKSVFRPVREARR